jgi:hypothetical protein
MAPAANLPALVDSLETLSIGSLFGAYVLEAYSQIYPEVTYDDVVTPRSQVLVKEIAYRCLHEPSILVSTGSALLLGADIYAGNPLNGPMGPYLEQNVPRGPIDVPLFIGQGLADQLIRPDAQASYVQERCAMETELGVPHLRGAGPHATGGARVTVGTRPDPVDAGPLGWR